VIEEVSLYIHIPFCKRKCPYCHFYVIPDKEPLKKVFSESLPLEWEKKLPLLQGKRVVSLYFGGGTPTLFAPKGIGAILHLIRNSSVPLAEDCEITVEANPEECAPDLLAALRFLGVNRLSLGVQSLDDRSLAILERGHGAKQAKKALRNASDAGFENLSIDLMYDLPDQTEASWRYTLDQIGDLPISHLSLYNLTIEPHTSFYKRRSMLSLPDPKASLIFLETALEALDRLGLKRYEISAFAKPGRESRHNLGYWTYRPFLGFGPSAFSFWDGERFRNAANLQRYARALKQGQSPVDFRERLPDLAAVKERLAVQLRLNEGVDLERYPPLPPETVLALDRWMDEGCLVREKKTVRLTKRGMLFYDTIATDLI